MDDFLKVAGGVLGTVAPLLARAAGGPLAGTAVGLLCGALGMPQGTSPDELAAAVQNATPDQLLALRTADNAFKQHMADLQLEPDRLDAADRDSARKLAAETIKAGDPTVNRLAWLNVLAFFLVALAVLVGCFLALNGALKVTAENTPIWMAVSGIIGTILGNLSANSQQVNSFFFGSSSGSKEHSDAIGQTMKTAMQGLTDAATAKGGVVAGPLAR